MNEQLLADKNVRDALAAYRFDVPRDRLETFTIVAEELYDDLKAELGDRLVISSMPTVLIKDAKGKEHALAIESHIVEATLDNLKENILKNVKGNEYLYMFVPLIPASIDSVSREINYNKFRSRFAVSQHPPHETMIEHRFSSSHDSGPLKREQFNLENVFEGTKELKDEQTNN